MASSTSCYNARKEVVKRWGIIPTSAPLEGGGIEGSMDSHLAGVIIIAVIMGIIGQHLPKIGGKK